ARNRPARQLAHRRLRGDWLWAGAASLGPLGLAVPAALAALDKRAVILRGHPVQRAPSRFLVQRSIARNERAKRQRVPGLIHVRPPLAERRNSISRTHPQLGGVVCVSVPGEENQSRCYATTRS